MKNLNQEQIDLLSYLIEEEFDNTRDPKKELDLISLAAALGLNELADDMQQTLDDDNFAKMNMDNFKEFFIK